MGFPQLLWSLQTEKEHRVLESDLLAFYSPHFHFANENLATKKNLAANLTSKERGRRMSGIQRALN
jgi:hypothetical protein